MGSHTDASGRAVLQEGLCAMCRARGSWTWARSACDVMAKPGKSDVLDFAQVPKMSCPSFVTLLTLEICCCLGLGLDIGGSGALEVLHINAVPRGRWDSGTCEIMPAKYIRPEQKLSVWTHGKKTIAVITYWHVNQTGSEVLLESCHVFVCFSPRTLASPLNFLRYMYFYWFWQKFL